MLFASKWAGSLPVGSDEAGPSATTAEPLIHALKEMPRAIHEFYALISEWAQGRSTPLQSNSSRSSFLRATDSNFVGLLKMHA